MRRTLVVLVVLALAAACGFPNVTFEAADAGKDRSAGSSSSGGDDSSSSSGGGTDAEGDSRTDGSSSGDSTTPDGPGLDAPQDTYVVMIDAAPDSPICDQDHDGFDRPECAGGTDCCDIDNMAYPGQAAFFPNEDVCHSFDYNCDGMLETGIPHNITCSGLAATGCMGGSGFTGDPGCGVPSPYSVCGPSGIACAFSSTMSTPQTCH